MNPHEPEEIPLETSPTHTAPVRSFQPTSGSYGWDNVAVLAYKPADTHFQGITRQVLFGEAEALASELRYFEIEPGGYSTLEKHRHEHAVLILRGQGRVLVDEAVYAIRPFDLVHVPSLAWHQFRADADEPLGFLCLVPCDRDRPQRPTPREAAALRAHSVAGSFIKL